MCNIVFSCVVDNFPFTTNKVQILSQVNESAIDTSKAIPLNYLNFLKSVDGYAGNWGKIDIVHTADKLEKYPFTSKNQGS
jgi:hypothetical protein